MSYQHVLQEDEKRELLRIARATLREYARTGRVPPGKPHRASLLTNAGVFVTLHRGAALRGCVGTLHDDTPLYKAIQDMAIAAATRDTRFAPVTPDELNALAIEISVLGDRRRIHDASELTVGTHGVCLTLGDARGLLLPQVAAEHGWDAAAFLERVCAKANLPDGSWRDPAAVLETFTAQVFDEATFPPAGR